MQVRHAAYAQPLPSQHRRHPRHHRALKIIATVTVSTLLAAFVAVGERIRQLDGNITVVHLSQYMNQADRPDVRATTSAQPAPGDPFGGKPVNILLTAIDTREGENATVVEDSMETLLNDVNMVAHISADRTRVDIAALPRDTLVPLPACDRADGSVSGPQRETMLNESFNKGAGGDPLAKEVGLACIMRTIESITNIPLDAAILVDFAGFASVVDALDGVDLCIPEGLSSRKTHIDLAPGLHHLDGATALQVARTRSGKLANGKSLDGSDLKRIDRQQQLIATVINEVLSSGSIKSLPKLNSVATAVTSALFVSPELGSVGAMAGMAYALRNIELANVSLFTAPVVDAGQRVRLAEWGQGNKFGGASAKEVFDYLALDQPVPGTTPYKLLHPEPETPADPTTSTSGNVPAPTPDVSADEGIITAVDTPVTEAACQVAGQGMD